MGNILVVLDNDFDSDNRVKRQCSLLRMAGWNVTILCYGDSSNLIYEEWQVKRISISPFRKSLLMPLENRFSTHYKFWKERIYSELLNNDYDKVIAHDLYMSRPTRSAISRSNSSSELILDLHEHFSSVILTYPWTQSFLKKTLSLPMNWKDKEKHYLNSADKIMFLSEYFRDSLIGTYPELDKKKTFIFPNVPDLEKLDQQIKRKVDLGFENDVCKFCYFGLIGIRRGILDFIDAFEEALKQDEKIALILIGPISKNESKVIKSRIEAIKDHVLYIEWIGFDDLASYLASVDVGISPLVVNDQHESGIANKVYQYMCFSLPLLVSNCKPQAALVNSTGSGMVYSDHSELVKEILDLSSNRKLRLEMGVNGRKAIVDKYNLKLLTKEFISFVNL